MTDNRIVVSEEQKIDLDFWRHAMKLNTCIPAIVDEFDPVTQRVSASPAIMGKYVKPDNTVEYIPCPKITNIPLAITKGAGLTITYPIKKGENCTLIFSQRSIDNFLIENGIQRPYDTDSPEYTTLRCMDMTDAMCFPGVITNKEAISSYDNDAIEIRNSDGETKLTVKENSLKFLQGNATIELSGGNITMNADNITINGTSSVTVGQVTSIDGVDFLTHIHDKVVSGQGKSGGVDIPTP